jgi:hypothetical protein
MFGCFPASVLVDPTDIGERGIFKLLGAKALAAALAALLLVPAAGATPGNGNGNGESQGLRASAGNGSGAAPAKETPPQAARGQARKAENAARNAERRAAREAAADDPQEPTRLNPAQTCKVEREEMGDEAFVEEYGENDNGANAFGKCVAQEARERDGVNSGDDGELPEPEAELEREAPATVEALALIRTVVHAMRGPL